MNRPQWIESEMRRIARERRRENAFDLALLGVLLVVVYVLVATILR